MLYIRVKYDLMFANSASHTPRRIEKPLLLPQLTNMSTNLKQETWPCSFFFLPSYNKIQFNVAIINNFVVLKTLSFPTQVWTSARFSIFLNFDICLLKSFLANTMQISIWPNEHMQICILV